VLDDSELPLFDFNLFSHLFKWHWFCIVNFNLVSTLLLIFRINFNDVIEFFGQKVNH
jgi:hypothetical protein